MSSGWCVFVYVCSMLHFSHRDTFDEIDLPLWWVLFYFLSKSIPVVVDFSTNINCLFNIEPINADVVWTKDIAISVVLCEFYCRYWGFVGTSKLIGLRTSLVVSVWLEITWICYLDTNNRSSIYAHIYWIDGDGNSSNRFQHTKFAFKLCGGLTGSELQISSWWLQSIDHSYQLQIKNVQSTQESAFHFAFTGRSDFHAIHASCPVQIFTPFFFVCTYPSHCNRSHVREIFVPSMTYEPCDNEKCNPIRHYLFV